MLGLGSASERDAVTAASQPLHNLLPVCAMVLAGTAIISSALHFGLSRAVTALVLNFLRIFAPCS